MKFKVLFGTAGLLSAGVLAWAANDPVVMTVNGVDVPKSEFEYLYNKNSQQQTDDQPLDQYVEMFKLYKMKVAAAKDAGIDTTAKFRSEMAQYRRELAMPYVVDSIYLNQLVDEAYNRSLQEAEANHIMVMKGRTKRENDIARHLIDSLYNELKNGGDFDDLAFRFSQDQTARKNKGHIGFIPANRYPYDFETVAFTLAPGEISEIVESNAGYHILLGGAKRPSQGSVKAAHIMKMVPEDASEEVEARAKAEIDSLYQIVIADPESFSTVATASSDDKGSARVGGQLGWFTTGQMVPEFSDVAFAMQTGEISEPVRTQFGWHIIKKLDARGPLPKEELKPEMLTRFNNPRDERFGRVRRHQNDQLAAKHNGCINPDVEGKLRSHVARQGIDTAFYENFKDDFSDALFIIDNEPVSVAVFMEGFNGSIIEDPYIAGVIYDDKLESSYNDQLLGAEEKWLFDNNTDYHNLMNEYEEGSLLYEISLQEVWDKASQDTAGLERYYRAHKKDYSWKEPKAKGVLVQAKNEEVAEKIRNRYSELSGDGALQTLWQEFRNEATIDRVLAPKGRDKNVDYLMFDGPKPEPNPNYPVVFMLNGKVLKNPEEMSDVKGQVTTDYQNELEKQWIKNLKKKYSVKVYDAVLKEVK